MLMVGMQVLGTIVYINGIDLGLRYRIEIGHTGEERTGGSGVKFHNSTISKFFKLVTFEVDGQHFMELASISIPIN